MSDLERTTAATSVERLRSIAQVWDNLVRIPVLGRRVGLDALIGIIPGVGDLAGGALGLYGMITAARLGVGPVVLLRMLLNIGIDTVIGFVPLLGDIFDIGWKSNTRNLALVEAWVGDPHRVRRSSATVLVAVGASVLLMLAGLAWLVTKLVEIAF